jgi:CheY-like chemotaxis protein
VFDTEEIVVKPVAPILRHVTMFSGNTILGDGSVIMILDPNGIASDIEMPGMSGFEFATAVKSDPRWRDTPVVALSAHAQPADLERATDAGFDGFVVKFDRTALLAKLSEALADGRRAA